MGKLPSSHWSPGSYSVRVYPGPQRYSGIVRLLDRSLHETNIGALFSKESVNVAQLPRYEHQTVSPGPIRTEAGSKCLVADVVARSLSWRRESMMPQELDSCTSS